MADTNSNSGGVQIKVWLPDGFYDLLKSRASRHGTSVAAEARRLMERGTAGTEGLEALADRLDRLDAYVRHLESLLYIAAADAAYGAAAWRHQHAVIPMFAEGLEELERDLSRRAIVRIQRQFRSVEDSPALTKEVSPNNAADATTSAPD